MFLEAANTLAPSSPTLPTSLGVAILSGYVMHLAKASKKLPWITFYTTKLNFAIRGVIAAVGTIGVGMKWAASSGGGGQLAITIPSVAVLLAGLYHWAVQFGVQHLSETVLQGTNGQNAAGPKP